MLWSAQEYDSTHEAGDMTGLRDICKERLFNMALTKQRTENHDLFVLI
jgi:hypothetical protein